MRRYGCIKRNPDPKWPYEQMVIAVPPDSQAATAAKMDNSLKVLENTKPNNELSEKENKNTESDSYFRETNMPIMGYWQKETLDTKNTLTDMIKPVCQKVDVSSYLCQRIGSYLRVEFLFGENTHIEKTGVLQSVGKDFLVLTESGTGTEIVCSSKNIKFINIYNLNKG